MKKTLALLCAATVTLGTCGSKELAITDAPATTTSSVPGTAATPRPGEAVVTTAPAAPGAAPTTTAATAVAPAPAPTPAPTAAPRSSGETVLSAESRLTFSGLGPVKIGSTVASIQSSSNARVQQEYAGGGDECRIGDVTGFGPINGYAMTINNAVAFITVGQGSVVQTLSGLKIGDTESRMKQLYPAARKYSPADDPTPQFRLLGTGTDAGRALDIAIDQNGKVESMTVGRFPEINYYDGCA